jgi:hypothetical protein
MPKVSVDYDDVFDQTFGRVESTSGTGIENSFGRLDYATLTANHG